MEQQINRSNYTQATKAIKTAILQSRYRAAKLVNTEILSLYYAIGEYISKNSRKESWGINAIKVISEQLQGELPGLRGFSETNIKNMRIFYEEWRLQLNRQLSTDDLQGTNPDIVFHYNDCFQNHQLPTDDFPLNEFLSIGFTHHIAIIVNAKRIEERLFYIRKCASEFWSVEKLKYYLKEKLFEKEGSLPNNFTSTISDATLRTKALRSFKDEYLLDFINIEDPDEIDERVLENKIVLNIKKFIMALGTDFSFLGNQYRLIVDEKEYFIDLLFFNRRLQSLVAIELKRGEFKPEYMGKLNFYLSALDEYVKLPHENSTIGIILCKNRSQKIVEFAFRDTSKPMGVATFKTEKELPFQYQGVLPNTEDLKNLL